MASNTPTPPSTIGVPAAEPRALGAVLDTSTPFATRGGTAALGAADAHLVRWGLDAPGVTSATVTTRPRAGRGGLSALSFADARLSNWMAASEGPAGLRSLRSMLGYARDGFATRNIPMVSWLMPRPAYLDDLAWIAEARAMRAVRPSGRATGSGDAPAHLPLHLLAPDVAAAPRGAEDPRGGFDDTTTDAWAPSVTSNQLDTGALLALASQGDRASSLAAMSPGASAAGVAPRSLPGALWSRLAGNVAHGVATTAPGPARAAALAHVASNMRAFVQATGAGDTTLPPRATEAGGEPAPFMPSPMSAGVALLLRSAERGQTPALVAGPPLLQPAGLGGALVAARMTARFEHFERAPESPRGFVAPGTSLDVAPRATAGGALAAMSVAPAALRHVAWADRWLGRVGGASDQTLATFAQAVDLPIARRIGGNLPLIQQAPAASSPSEGFERGAGPRAALSSRAIADDDVTPDEVLMAIASARGRGPGLAPNRGVPSSMAPVVATAPRPAMSAIDAVLARPATLDADAGLAVALAASPMASALRGVTGGGGRSALDVPAAGIASRVFDVRSLMPAQVALAYLAAPMAAAPTTALAPVGSSRSTAPASIAPEQVVDRESAGESASAVGPLARAWQPLFVAPTATDVALGGGASSGAAATFAAQPITSRGRPGDLAVAATLMAHATEQSAGDLAFDFVRPETMVAARSYGLSPQDAVTAERLALVGPARLSATAAALEHTLVRQLLGGTAARGDDADQASPSSPAMPFAAAVGGASTPVNDAVEVDAAAGDADDAVGAVGFSVGFDDARMLQRTRRGALPRGAFLWPAAAVTALGLEASAATAAASSPQLVVALELLAARAVANLGVQVMPGLAATGTFDARVGADWVAPGRTAGRPGRGAVGADGREHDDGLEAPRDIGPTVGDAYVATAQRGDAATVDVGTSLGSMVAASTSVTSSPSPAMMARRGALPSPMYVALAEHARDGAAAPIAPSAARAMALAARDGGVTSARARAQLAWSVLPVVHVGLEGAARPGVTSREGLGGEASMGQTGYAQVAGFDADYLEGMAAAGNGPAGQPMLRGVSARAGAALRSYVGPENLEVVSTGATASSARAETPRAPTAAPELVRTGNTGARYGGGEVEIPGWFEAAARKMLEQRSSGSDFSLADLTLVAAAPAAQIAASSKHTAVSASAASSSQSASSNTRGAAASPDIERLARDVYDQFMQLIDVARWRNYGDR